ncbi:hypothetical protein FDP41_003435 [Naegleria fowleri]|uniref:Uncharacterized protein n=1 Tax=Naegleria fowleri TaxID=5763 RepID=A0A6A5BHV1_NAEFO|nr:uncharacterized protein FDP41_003435 [Naegleria fowleri]KAF0977443.1 hypothetical protein FDP41_003435 [Naegleria fowleri]CAG4713363.1 unnamed protein product [Naegleria fowleri]
MSRLRSSTLDRERRSKTMFASSLDSTPSTSCPAFKYHQYDHQRYSPEGFTYSSNERSSFREPTNFANILGQKPKSELDTSFSFLRIISTFATNLGMFYNPPLNIDNFYNSEKRRWLIAGNFSSISVNTTTFNNLNNIAVFNGKAWKGLGNGTNGNIRTVFIDTCFNMYAGGDFTQAGNLETGPIARWSITKRRWESISESVTWKKNSSVRSISVDCFQTPSEISRCQCNVWIAGSFELEIASGNASKTAINVAMYQPHTNTWFSMREYMDHNLTISMTANSIFKRDFGQTFHSRKTFVGGKFPYILTWDPYYKNWSKIMMNDTNAEVTQIHFHKSILGVNLFNYWNYVVVGKFEFTFPDGDSNSTCKNLCMMDFRNGQWVKVADNFELLDSPVRQVSTTDGHIFAIGDFQDIDVGNLAVISTDGVVNSFFNNTMIPNNNYTSLYLCKQTDLDCTLYSAGLADTQGRIWFYDSETRNTHLFGTINAGGLISYLSSIYLYFLSDYM